MNARVLEGMLEMGPEVGRGEGGKGMALLADFWEFPDGLVELVVGWNFV